MKQQITDLLKKFEQKRGKIDLSLTRIVAFLEKLGNPHLKTPPVIHFAGTNGKGSTIAFLRAMIEASGKTCHIYTSPHLVNYNERIVLAGAEISDEALYKVLQEVDQKADDENLTYFEITTAAAFLAFASCKADYLLLETGLGGRLDCTNVIPVPLLTVITPISFDHTEFLGNTLTAIAGEKAGIMKANRPCISAPQLPEAIAALTKKANELNCDLQFAEVLDLPKLSLCGEHQKINASTAIACAKSLGVSQSAIDKGLQTAKWRARLQKLEKGELVDLLPPNFELWLDGAHNPDGAKVLADFIKTNFQNRKKYLIVGMLENKDAAEYSTFFEGLFDKVYTIPILNQKCYTSQKLAEFFENTTAMPSANEAVSEIVKENQIDSSIFIAGSLYLAGQILENNS